MLKAIGRVAVLFFITLAVLYCFWSLAQGQRSPVALKYSEFLTDVSEGKVQEVTISGDKISGKFTLEKGQPDKNQPKEFYCFFRKEMQPPPEDVLAKSKVKFEVKDSDTSPWWPYVIQTVAFLCSSPVSNSRRW